MTKDDQFNPDSTKIERIVVTKAAIENKTSLVSLEKQDFYFDIQYSFVLAVNTEMKLLRIIFSCQIDTYTKPKILLDLKGRFDIAYYFEINNINDFVKESDSGHKVEQRMIVSLANIAYSTSRGIIYTRCQGTILKEVILPILPNDKLLTQLNQKKKSPVRKKSLNTGTTKKNNN